MTHDPTQTKPDERRLRLEALIAERRGAAFAWGSHDCCLWAADCVLAMTGVDPAADLRGRYDSAISAARLLEAIGGMDAAGARAGEPIPPLCAQVGDIGLVNDERSDLLAVCVGGHWLAPAIDGLAAMPLRSARKAWRVG